MYHTDTFIKLNRKIANWRWYQDPTTFRVFVHLIIKANVFDNDFNNITVHRGQLVTSYGHLAADLGFYKDNKIMVQPVRTAINHLKNTGEIAVERFAKGLIITIVNYESYQGELKYTSSHQHSANNMLTATQQSTNNELTENQQQYNKLNKENKSNKIYKSKSERQKLLLPPLGQFENVFLTQEEKDDLENKYPKTYNGKIQRLSRYLVNSKRVYANHYALLISWLEEDKEIDNINPQPIKSEKISYDIEEFENYSMFD